jgi:hypothetical protein
LPTSTETRTNVPSVPRFPGLRNVGADNKFVKSATLTMHFESWVAKDNKRISPVVKWDVKVTVKAFEGKITGGVE